MNRIILIFASLLLLVTAWGMGYRTGRLDADAEIYAAGYDDGYGALVNNLNH